MVVANPSAPVAPGAPAARSGLDAWIARGQESATLDAAARAKARTRRFDTIAVHGLYDHLAAAANQGSNPLIPRPAAATP